MLAWNPTRKPNYELSSHEARLHLTLHWRHNGCDGVSNHQPYDCLLKRLFSRRSKKAVTGEFSAQMASIAENASIWWRHHESWFTLIHQIKSIVIIVRFYAAWNRIRSHEKKGTPYFVLKAEWLSCEYMYVRKKEIQVQAFSLFLVFRDIFTFCETHHFSEVSATYPQIAICVTSLIRQLLCRVRLAPAVVLEQPAGLDCSYSADLSSAARAEHISWNWLLAMLPRSVIWMWALPLHINGSVITRMYFLESISHKRPIHHYNDAIMSAMASQIPILTFQAQIKENIKAPLHRPLWGEFTGDLWIPAQRASNAENVSIWWRHHDNCWCVVPHAFIKYIWHVSNCISFKSFNATVPEIEIHAQNKWLLILWVI